MEGHPKGNARPTSKLRRGQRTAVVHVKPAEASSEKIDVRDGALDMYFIRCHIFVCQDICMLDFDPCLVSRRITSASVFGFVAELDFDPFRNNGNRSARLFPSCQ